MDVIHFLLLVATIAALRILLFFIARVPKPLNDLVCVITGGAGEIGQIVTSILLEKGVRMVIWDNNESNIERMKQRMSSDMIYYFKVDVSNSSEVEKATEEVVDQLGGVDILINNAAIANPFDIEESTVEELRTTMNVNLMAHFWTIRALLPHLRKSKIYNGLKGSIVGMSSVLGNVGTGGLQTYCSSKAGIIGLMESLYMQHTDIHWCIITPFLVNTHLFKGMRHKYMDYFYPMLDKNEVAKKVVEGIEFQQCCITLPWFWNYLFVLVKNIFPLPMMRTIENWFDVRVAYRQIYRRSERPNQWSK
ncbi:17-beta-hydroxysteroid dehydrogenase 13-like [Bolinopsis microptera]|uniref:17-beta-hydroxysteroid dehydrogenase 13-like n=1 Tax=Bolinopsis microptera TaxID=2820187 RepID=UPI00307A416E